MSRTPASAIAIALALAACSGDLISPEPTSEPVAPFYLEIWDPQPAVEPEPLPFGAQGESIPSLASTITVLEPDGVTVAGVSQTLLSGGDAWAYLFGDAHPSHRAWADSYDDDADYEGASAPLDWIPGDVSSTTIPRDLPCEESPPFQGTWRGARTPFGDELAAGDCYARAATAASLAYQELVADGEDPDLVVHFVFPSPALDDPPGEHPDGGSCDEELPLASAAGPGGLPRAPRPGDPIAGRSAHNFPGAARPAYEAAFNVQTATARHMSTLQTRLATATEIAAPTDVIVLGAGPGGSTLVGHAGRRATSIRIDVGWEPFAEYPVVQRQMDLRPFSPQGLPNAELLTTGTLRATGQANTSTLGYQLAYMNYILVSQAGVHYVARATRYGVRTRAGQRELVVTMQAPGIGEFTIYLRAGQRWIDASGPGPTPRVGTDLMSVRNPNTERVGQPVATAWGGAIIDPIATLGPRSLTVADTATGGVARFNGETVIVWGGGGAGWQTLGRILAGCPNGATRIRFIHRASDLAAIKADPNLYRPNDPVPNDITRAVQAYEAGDPRIVREVINDILVPGVVEGGELAALRLVPRNPGAREHQLQFSGTAGGARFDFVGDWFISCVGPGARGSPHLTPAEIPNVAIARELLSTLTVHTHTAGGVDYPLYVSAADGMLVYQPEVSAAIARYVRQLRTASPADYALVPEAVRAALERFLAPTTNLGALNRALNGGTGRPPFEFAAQLGQLQAQALGLGGGGAPRPSVHGWLRVDPMPTPRLLQ